jgi:hypothetical protein
MVTTNISSISDRQRKLTVAKVAQKIRDTDLSLCMSPKQKLWEVTYIKHELEVKCRKDIKCAYGYYTYTCVCIYM